MSLGKMHAVLLLLITSIAIAGCTQSSPWVVPAESLTRNLAQPAALAPIMSTPAIGSAQTSNPPAATIESAQAGISAATVEPTQTGISAPTIEPIQTEISAATVEPTQTEVSTATIEPTRTEIPAPSIAPAQTEIPKPVFDQFIETVKTGEKGRIVGLWAQNKLALQVVYQPADDPAFVSTQGGTATYFLYVFQQAANRGFLAHNYLSGKLFFGLKLGDIVEVVYGDGSYEDFEVLDIREYQALSPESPTSNFVDLTSGEQLSSTQLFIKVYQGDYRTTLQTCIARGSQGSWGRIFVVAPLLP